MSESRGVRTVRRPMPLSTRMPIGVMLGNVTGDLAVAIVVSRGEKQRGEGRSTP